MLESKLQAKILTYLRSLPECWVVKVIIGNVRGCPDIVCCYRGKFIGLEVKPPDGKLSAAQIEQGKRINDAGGQWYVVTNTNDVKNALGEL